MTNIFYKHIHCCFFTLALLLSALFQNKSVAQPIVSLTPVISSGLVEPMQLVNAGDGSNRSFIVGKRGTIWVYDSAFNFLDTFLTVTGIRTLGEEGLLSLAFHPQYETNGFFYIYYVNAAGNLEIARYHVSSNPNEADTNTKVVVLTIPHPSNANHNGGELHFGTDDRLYLSTGDGGGGGDVANNAQNNSVLLGKIIRIDVNTSTTAPFYTVPAGNPYGNEVFASGLRNPFRWSIDRLTGDMWIGDVGQGGWEEISYRQADSANGANYGWRCYEGNETYNTSGCATASNYVFPVYVYPNPGPAAVTGGLVYRGSGSPALYGYYVATDFYSNNFYLIYPDGNGGFNTYVQAITPSVTNISDFGETENRELYAVALSTGVVYHVTAVNGSPVPVTLANFSANALNRQVQLAWRTTFERNFNSFDIEYSPDGTTFSYAGTVPALNRPSGASYSFLHIPNNGGTAFYRLKMKEGNGRLTYSTVVRVEMNSKSAYVSPSVISNGIIQLNLSDEKRYASIEVIGSSGAVVLKRDIDGQAGRLDVPAAELLPGIYMIRFVGKNTEPFIQKIVVN